jgi:hypothetical protein
VRENLPEQAAICVAICVAIGVVIGVVIDVVIDVVIPAIRIAVQVAFLFIHEAHLIRIRPRAANRRRIRADSGNCRQYPNGSDLCAAASHPHPGSTPLAIGGSISYAACVPSPVPVLTRRTTWIAASS